MTIAKEIRQQLKASKVVYLDENGFIVDQDDDWRFRLETKSECADNMACDYIGVFDNQTVEANIICVGSFVQCMEWVAGRIVFGDLQNKYEG